MSNLVAPKRQSASSAELSNLTANCLPLALGFTFCVELVKEDETGKY